jgi:hypothetical protein
MSLASMCSSYSKVAKFVLKLEFPQKDGRGEGGTIDLLVSNPEVGPLVTIALAVAFGFVANLFLPPK